MCDFFFFLTTAAFNPDPLEPAYVPPLPFPEIKWIFCHSCERPLRGEDKWLSTLHFVRRSATYPSRGLTISLEGTDGPQL